MDVASARAYQRRMAEAHIVVVPPPGIDGSRSIKDLLNLLRRRGCETTVADLEHIATAPGDARLLLLYRGLEAVLVEAMARGAQPSGPVGPWMKSASAILKTQATRTQGAALVDFADLELSAATVVDRLLGETAGTTRPHGRRVATGDPVLRALAGTAATEMPKARKLDRDLEAAALLAPPDAAAKADTAFLYYTGMLQRRDPAAEELTAAALAEFSAERDRLRAEAAILRDKLAAHGDVNLGTTISLGPTFTHPAFYDLERSASGRLFRWMGRRREAVLPVPLAASESVKVVVTLELVIDDDALAGLEISLDRHQPQSTETGVLPNAQFTKTAIFSGLSNTGDILDVTLRQTHVVDGSAHGDPRMLGCGIAAVAVVPMPAAPKREKVASPADLDDDAPDDAAASSARPDRSGLSEIVIAVDGAFRETAFYPMERRPDGLPFAWMGVRDEQAFTVTIPLDRTVEVEVHMAMAIDRAAVDGLELEFDHETPRTTEVVAIDGLVVKRAVFSPVDQSRTLPEPVHVVLKSTHTADVSEGDDRRVLSIGLNKLVVRQV